MILVLKSVIALLFKKAQSFLETGKLVDFPYGEESFEPEIS